MVSLQTLLICFRLKDINRSLIKIKKGDLLKNIFNPTWTKQEVMDFLAQIKNNNGYCPCSVVKDDDHKCMCKEFQEQKSGACHCGLYVKTEG